jgi:branched-chain amino acid transport system ATP-binding protein
MTLLQVESACCHFGSLIAVDKVSMAVQPGELRAVIGPNGAGKTTFFNLISGYITPTAGRILLDNRDITALPPHVRVKQGMARTFQITEIFPELTVRDNLRIPVEVAAGHRLRPWLPSAAAATVRREVDILLDLGGLSARRTAWWASSRTAISARPRS